MRSNKELLTQVYAAFNARNIDAALSLMTPDVDWPNAMEGLRVVGPAEVRAYWTRQWEMFDPHVHPISMEDDPHGRTIVEVHQVVHDLEGKLLMDQNVRHVYSIENGLIARMDIPDTATPQPWSTK